MLLTDLLRVDILEGWTAYKIPFGHLTPLPVKELFGLVHDGELS